MYIIIGWDTLEHQNRPLQFLDRDRGIIRGYIHQKDARKLAPEYEGSRFHHVEVIRADPDWNVLT